MLTTHCHALFVEVEYRRIECRIWARVTEFFAIRFFRYSSAQGRAKPMPRICGKKAWCIWDSPDWFWQEFNLGWRLTIYCSNCVAVAVSSFICEEKITAENWKQIGDIWRMLHRGKSLFLDVDLFNWSFHPKSNNFYNSVFKPVCK